MMTEEERTRWDNEYHAKVVAEGEAIDRKNRELAEGAWRARQTVSDSRLGFVLLALAIAAYTLYSVNRGTYTVISVGFPSLFMLIVFLSVGILGIFRRVFLIFLILYILFRFIPFWNSSDIFQSGTEIFRFLTAHPLFFWFPLACASSFRQA